MQVLTHLQQMRRKKPSARGHLSLSRSPSPVLAPTSSSSSSPSHSFGNPPRSLNTSSSFATKPRGAQGQQQVASHITTPSMSRANPFATPPKLYVVLECLTLADITLFSILEQVRAKGIFAAGSACKGSKKMKYPLVLSVSADCMKIPKNGTKKNTLSTGGSSKMVFSAAEQEYFIEYFRIFCVVLGIFPCFLLFYVFSFEYVCNMRMQASSCMKRVCMLLPIRYVLILMRSV